jgi:hypothetical protein
MIRPRSHCGRRRSRVTLSGVRSVALLPLLLLCLWPCASFAKGGDDDGGRQEQRVSGRCSSGGTAKLRLRSRDGAIRVDFDARVRSGSRWRVVVVHERRVASRATLRARSGGISLRRSLPDLDGADQVSVRASGPGGATCSASASLPG